MRITPTVLLQHAKHYVRERAKKDRSLTCVYLAGSMLEENPLIDGAGDIDLIFVHAYPENMERELVAITDEIHFDIQHHLQEIYEDPKRLRRDAWLGDTLWQKPTVFFEKNHWFDFILAGAFSQFTTGENILWRSKRFTDLARSIQQQALMDIGASAALTRLRYLLAIEASANGLVSLVGSPLPLRRMLIDFPSCAVDLGKPEMTAQMIALFSPVIPSITQITEWIDTWASDYQMASQQPDCPASLQALKQPYYEKAMRAQLTELPAAALWLLARTWCALDYNCSEKPAQESFEAFLTTLNLTEDHLEERFESLDEWINVIEDLQDQRADSEGLSPLSEWEEDLSPGLMGEWYLNWGCSFTSPA